MSEFFQLLQANPILVFSGIVASILGFIIGIPLTVYLYKRGTKKRGLTYRVNPVRTSIVRAGAASRLAVLHDGREIKSDITAAHIAISNQGRESIRQVDMLRPLILETADHTPILEATIQMATHDVIGLPEESEKFCTLEKISFEKPVLAGTLNKRRDTVGEPISILRPTCLHAMFQAPLGLKKP